MRVTTPAVRILVGAVLAAAFVAGAAGAASAVPGTSDVTVAVPTATPTGAAPPAWQPVPATKPPAAVASVPPAVAVPGKAAGGGASGSTAGGASAPPAPAGPAGEPVVAPGPSTAGERATTDREHYVLGGQISVRLDGFMAGEQVQIVLYSAPRVIANVPAGADGVLTHTFVVPDDLPVGTHTVQLTGWESQRIGTAEIFVTAASAATASSDAQGVPAWAWWAGGGLGALLLVGGGWWVLRTMRAPEPAGATA